MPYVSLPEQGYRNPGDQILDAARSLLVNKQLKQKVEQDAEAFPIEQQQRQASATESTKKAAVVDQTLALQQQAQTLQNQGTVLENAFRKETDPIRKMAMRQQLQQVAAAIQNLQVQGGLLTAQTGETEARGGLYTAQTRAANLGTANTKTSPGTLDPYGNQVVHTTRTGPNGEVLQEEDEFKPGRGVPRVAYKQVWDRNAGTMKRVPGVVELDPNTGSLNVQFPDDAEADAAAANPEPDPVFTSVVDRFFDAESGVRNQKKPSNAKERAALNQLVHNKAQLDAYDLKLDGTPAPAAKTPQRVPIVPTRKPAVPAMDDADGGPEATPGISSNGAPVKTPAGPSAGKAGGGIPIAGAKQPGGTFKDLSVGDEFMQGGVRYRKTGDATADPVTDS